MRQFPVISSIKLATFESIYAMNIRPTTPASMGIYLCIEREISSATTWCLTSGTLRSPAAAASKSRENISTKNAPQYRSSSVRV